MRYDESIPISGDYQFIVVTRNLIADLTEDEKYLIERIWEGELRLQKGHLFNGQLFCAIEINPEQLIGYFVPYKLYIAQLRIPALKKKLQIYPVSITGLTLLGETVLIGKRSKYVIQYPGYFELVPSGGVDDQCVEGDRINVIRQYQIELQEEAGIAPQYIENIVLRSIKFNAIEHIYEICADIKVKNEFETVTEFKSHEHQELSWVSYKQLEPFMSLHRKNFVPFSCMLLVEYISRKSD